MKIAALSDLHGHPPPAIPPCDLLIVAGDICPDYIDGQDAAFFPEKQAMWYGKRIYPWLDAINAPAVLTWGNHDWCGQARPLWRDDDRIVVDRVVTVAGLRVWASPWSNRFGGWAFMAHPHELAPIYAAIPEDVDIIVSHGPPYGNGDENAEGEHCGSRELLAAIRRVRPSLVVCGHIHEGYGQYDCDGIPILNVSLVDEAYRLVHPPTIFDMPLFTE